MYSTIYIVISNFYSLIYIHPRNIYHGRYELKYIIIFIIYIFILINKSRILIIFTNNFIESTLSKNGEGFYILKRYISEQIHRIHQTGKFVVDTSHGRLVVGL